MWRPSAAQVGLAAAGLGGLGALGYLAANYPKTATKLGQRALGGTLRMLPKIYEGKDPVNLLGDSIMSAVLPFGSTFK
jgi:hypothetical protein